MQQRLPASPPLLLVKPSIGLSTPEIFRALDLGRASQQDPQQLLDGMLQHGPEQRLCVNDLEQPAFDRQVSVAVLCVPQACLTWQCACRLPELCDLKARLQQSGAFSSVFMSGKCCWLASGSFREDSRSRISAPQAAAAPSCAWAAHSRRRGCRSRSTARRWPCQLASSSGNLVHGIWSKSRHDWRHRGQVAVSLMLSCCCVSLRQERSPKLLACRTPMSIDKAAFKVTKVRHLAAQAAAARLKSQLRSGFRPALPGLPPAR